MTPLCASVPIAAFRPVFARHRLKGGKEQMFKDVLRGLDLYHPPCERLTANRMFCVLGALAYT